MAEVKKVKAAVTGGTSIISQYAAVAALTETQEPTMQMKAAYEKRRQIVLDALDDLGLRENTYVIFTADNGLAVGRHGLMGKQNLYEHSSRVPLIIAGPGVTPGRVARRVETVDVAPTIAAYLGTKPPSGALGVPLVEALESVAGATGNIVYEVGVKEMRDEVATGQRLLDVLDEVSTALVDELGGAECKRLLQDAVDQADRASDIVKNLLEFSRAQSAGHENLDLAALLLERGLPLRARGPLAVGLLVIASFVAVTGSRGALLAVLGALGLSALLRAGAATGGRGRLGPGRGGHEGRPERHHRGTLASTGGHDALTRRGLALATGSLLAALAIAARAATPFPVSTRIGRQPAALAARISRSESPITSPETSTTV